MSITTGGVIQLRDKENTSEKTSAQIISSPLFDSRIYPNYHCIPAWRIRQLRNDPTIQLARWCVLSQMIHTPWVYIKNKKFASKEIVTFLDQNLLPLRDLFLQQACFGTLDFGWNPFEVVYKPEDGMIWIDNFKSLLQDFTEILVYTNNGKFAGFTNSSYNQEQFQDAVILGEYALNTNFEVEGTDWYGYSVFRALQLIVNSWDRVQDVANRYDRKMAGATWVIYYPVGRTKYNGVELDNDEIARRILANLESSGTVAIPDEIQEWLDDTVDREAKGKWRLDILESKSSSQAQFIDRQKYLDALKMRAFGLTERSVLEGSHGTKAEADVHADVSLSTVDSRHRLLCNCLNLTTVPNLIRLNFGKKYMWSVRVRPAPLVDNQFATIKEMYRMFLQGTEVIDKEVASWDMDAIRSELGIPSVN